MYFNLEFCASWLGFIPVIHLKTGPEVHHKDLHIKSTSHWDAMYNFYVTFLVHTVMLLCLVVVVLFRCHDSNL